MTSQVPITHSTESITDKFSIASYRTLTQAIRLQSSRIRAFAFYAVILSISGLALR
ncbi:hypothetical protein GALL_521310 [mine drainage metagenome]|uniref:Uncharacterized protein n=1 Tax=mine drainage metagenome TaxID=410659 RepID=A0A1J5PRV1_9ZZZZ